MTAIDFLAAVLDSPEPYVALGHWVKTERTAREWTQEDLAQRLGLGRPSIANMESGRQRIHFHTFVILANLFWSEAPEKPRPVVGKSYLSACDCPSGWVTCNRAPCARAEAIMAGIRSSSQELAKDPAAAREMLERCGALSNQNTGG